MNAARNLIILVLLCLGAGFLYWNLTRPEMPVNRVIENAEGKTLDVIIQGNMGGTLFVDRAADGERFEIPIRSLGWKDRIFVMRLPEQAPPVKIVVQEEPVDPYVEGRLRTIETLKAKRAVVDQEIKSKTLNEMLLRKRRQDIRVIDDEIRTLELAIETYKYRVRAK